MIGLAQIAHPVCIVAAEHEGRRSCATATTMYASLSPAILLVSHRPESETSRLARGSGQLSISLLAGDQLELATLAGRSAEGPDKLATLGIPASEPPAGLLAPGIEGSLVTFWCRVLHATPTGEQLVFAAEVIAERVGSAAGATTADGGAFVGDAGDDGQVVDERAPLLRHLTRYRAGGDWLSGPAPEGYPL